MKKIKLIAALLSALFLTGVVAERGFSVSYAPVGQLFVAFEEDKFRPQPDAARTEDVFACDLLIIDDLGTEMTTQFTVSVLYQLLNTRLMEKKPVILSTNLTPGELVRHHRHDYGVGECHQREGHQADDRLLLGGADRIYLHGNRAGNQRGDGGGGVPHFHPRCDEGPAFHQLRKVGD